MATNLTRVKQGEQTNKQRVRDRVYKTKAIDMTGKTYVKDNSYPVNTWILKPKNEASCRSKTTQSQPQ
jgi:hypothetical protein